MDIFGIGPLELAFIILLIIIIFGPKDIANTTKTVGKSLNKLIRSDAWKTINQTSRELRNLPNRLMRESGLDELEQTTRQEVAGIDQSIHQSIAAASQLEPTPGAPAEAQAPQQAPTSTGTNGQDKVE
jgi:sec-independent protein translocase protein TatB